MVGIREVVEGLAQRPGVTATVLLSADGLAIDQAGPATLDGDALAALAATLAQHAARLGQALETGSLARGVLEYDRGVLVFTVLANGNCLAVVAAPEADLGQLLFDLRQHRPALAELL